MSLFTEGSLVFLSFLATFLFVEFSIGFGLVGLTSFSGLSALRLKFSGSSVITSPESANSVSSCSSSSMLKSISFCFLINNVRTPPTIARYKKNATG